MKVAGSKEKVHLLREKCASLSLTTAKYGTPDRVVRFSTIQRQNTVPLSVNPGHLGTRRKWATPILMLPEQMAHVCAAEVTVHGGHGAQDSA